MPAVGRVASLHRCPPGHRRSGHLGGLPINALNPIHGAIGFRTGRRWLEATSLPGRRRSEWLAWWKSAV